MSDPQEKRRGRPATYEGEAMRQIGTRLPASVHERLLTVAHRRQQSVHQVVRDVLIRTARDLDR